MEEILNIEVSVAKPLSSGILENVANAKEKPVDLTDFIEQNTIAKLVIDDKKSE